MKRLFYIMTVCLSMFLTSVVFTSCEKTCELEEMGQMGDSYWTSYSMEKVAPFYSIKFSGKNDCRFRSYVTLSIDIDHDARYEVNEEGIIFIYERSVLLGTLRFIDDNTLEFSRDGKVTLFYRK